MKILLVASSYLPNIGGLELVTASLAEGLKQRGNSIAVITQRYPRTLLGVEEINGVPVQRWHFIFPRFEQLRHGRVDLFIAGLFYFPVTLVHLIAWIRGSKTDVVNLHFVGAPSLFLLIARRLINFRLIVSLHGDDVEGLPQRSRFDRWLFRAVLHRANAVTACSRYLLDRTMEVGQSITPQARVIYNGLEIQRIAAANPSNGVLVVGRMVRKKGFDLLLRALVELKDVRARLIGDGPERRALESLALELGLQDRIEFHGAQSHDEVMRAIAASKVVVIPSRQEPFGLVALEAMAAGKPIVAARVGGLPEILDGADACLFETENTASLAEMLRSALNTLECNPEFGECNCERVQRFSMERMIADYETVYSSP